jgi:spore coat polysaccharide biosynthesis protein SpsF (cytidylyltransferase family)
MGSTRLPGKVLRPLAGEPVLGRIVERLRRVPEIAEVIVATSDLPIDTPIADFCASRNTSYFRGSETDVLDRFYRAALQAKAEVLVRVTGDCPLVDPSLVSSVLQTFAEGRFDHYAVACGAGVAHEGFKAGRFPDGMDAEAFTMKALKEAWNEATLPLHREHVTPFLWSQPKRFRLGNHTSVADYSDWRLTLDHEGDLRLIDWVYRQLATKHPHFGLREVVQLLEANPDVRKANAEFVGNEGYEVFWTGKESAKPSAYAEPEENRG